MYPNNQLMVNDTQLLLPETALSGFTVVFFQIEESVSYVQNISINSDKLPSNVKYTLFIVIKGNLFLRHSIFE